MISRQASERVCVCSSLQQSSIPTPCCACKPPPREIPRSSYDNAQHSTHLTATEPEHFLCRAREPPAASRLLLPPSAQFSPCTCHNVNQTQCCARHSSRHSFRHSFRHSLLNLRLLMLNSLKRFIVVRLHRPLQAVVPAPTNKKRAPQKPSKQKTLCSLLHQLRKLLLLLRATQTGLHLGKLHKHTSRVTKHANGRHNASPSPCSSGPPLPSSTTARSCRCRPRCRRWPSPRAAASAAPPCRPPPSEARVNKNKAEKHNSAYNPHTIKTLQKATLQGARHPP